MKKSHKLSGRNNIETEKRKFENERSENLEKKNDENKKVGREDEREDILENIEEEENISKLELSNISGEIQHED